MQTECRLHSSYHCLQQNSPLLNRKLILVHVVTSVVMISAVCIIGEATRDEYNPAYYHLVKLMDECNQKKAPDCVITGIQQALRLIEVCTLYCIVAFKPVR